MESLDERLDRIEREADSIPQLDKLSDQALRLLLSQHIMDLCSLESTLMSKSLVDIVQSVQSKYGILGMLLRECEIRIRSAG
ncbi:MAG: hypothetical protein COA84_01610 [Robiginitomaculum sp.]|nr:MAG: hypothetical protein COA84_01610 [Robiginitomaculum sp.]